MKCFCFSFHGLLYILATFLCRGQSLRLCFDLNSERASMTSIEVSTQSTMGILSYLDSSQQVTYTSGIFQLSSPPLYVFKTAPYLTGKSCLVVHTFPIGDSKCRVRQDSRWPGPLYLPFVGAFVDCDTFPPFSGFRDDSVLSDDASSLRVKLGKVPPSAPSRSPLGTVVCLTGSMRAAEYALPSIAQHILSIGGAEGTEVVAYVAKDGTQTQNLTYLADVAAMLRVERETDIEPSIPGVDWKRALRIEGAWIANNPDPVDGPERKGTGFLQMWGHQKCLHMLREVEERRGRPFARVVFTRPDIVWHGPAPHPPLALLPDASLNTAWIPVGQDWGGVNNRHAVLGRYAADAFLGGLDLVQAGVAAPLIESALRSYCSLEDYGVNTERWVKLRLLAAGVTIERFPASYYISCHVPTRTMGSFCSPGLPKYRGEELLTRNLLECSKRLYEAGNRPQHAYRLTLQCWCLGEDQGQDHVGTKTICSSLDAFQ